MIRGYYQNYGFINILGGPAAGLPAQYRLIEPHFLNNQFVTSQWFDVDSILTEGINIPFGWVPTLAVDPLNNGAAAQLWTAGPRDVATASSSNLNIYDNLYRSPIPPVTYWKQITGHLTTRSFYVNYGSINIMSGASFLPPRPGQWVLTGLGAIFGPRGE